LSFCRTRSTTTASTHGLRQSQFLPINTVLLLVASGSATMVVHSVAGCAPASRPNRISVRQLTATMSSSLCFEPAAMPSISARMPASRASICAANARARSRTSSSVSLACVPNADR
jgi:hypothetical protein